MSNLYIHHFNQLLKEQENDIGHLTVLMHQTSDVVEKVRRRHLLINEAYEDWCDEVNK